MRRFVLISAVAMAAICLAGRSARSEREVVDQIIAVVGEEVVLASELANQIQLYFLQSGRQPRTESEMKELQENIIDQMISDRLFLIAAREDTMISVRTEEIELEESLDDQVLRISQNFESYDKFLDALTAEGLTLRDLKKKYRSDIENQLLKQRYIQSKLYTVSVSRKEVEDFHQQFKDSIPAQPEGVKLAHILLAHEPSQQVEDSVKGLATELRQNILDGADFAVISTQYSSAGAGANGGDLGYLSRTDVVEEFARAAFKLSIGDISGVIRTQFGYHVIKCEGKRDDRLRLRHILLGVLPSAADSAATLQLADSLLQEVRSGSDFEAMAKAYSVDNDTRAQGGELGWFATSKLPPEFADAVSSWSTPGEYRGPVQSRYGIHILKLLEYQADKEYSLEDDFDRIKEMARQDKTGKLMDEWIEKLKEDTYIKVNVEI